MSEHYTKFENSPHREAPNKHIKGSRKYKRMISESSKQMDKHGNLPFTFGKPPKRSQARRDIYFLCFGCLNVKTVSKFTEGVCCNKCNKYVNIDDTNSFKELSELVDTQERLAQESD